MSKGRDKTGRDSPVPSRPGRAGPGQQNHFFLGTGRDWDRDSRDSGTGRDCGTPGLWAGQDVFFEKKFCDNNIIKQTDEMCRV